MEWKKISSMEYGKIVFHSIPYHALLNAAVSEIFSFKHGVGASNMLYILIAFIGNLNVGRSRRHPVLT